MENKKRTLGFTIGFISAVIALVTGIVLWIYGSAVGDHYAVAPIILILGACIALVGLVMKLPFLSILPGAAYMTANTITEIVKVPAKAEAEDGDMVLSLDKHDAAKCRDHLKGLMLHLKNTEEQYPEYLTVKTTEV